MKNKLNSKTDVIEAAGGLLWRDTPHGKKLALIHRPCYDDWTLPTGKRESGESWQETALREVWEETGLQAELGSFAGSIAYRVDEIPKVVLYWNMQVAKIANFEPNNEVDRMKWVSLEKALKLVSYADEIVLLEANRPSDDP